MAEITHLPSFVQIRHLPSSTEKDIMLLLKAHTDLRYRPWATLQALLPPVPQTTWLIVFDV